MAEAIRLGLIEPAAVLSLQPDEYADIVAALRTQPADSELRLKPVFDQLDGKYDYGVLKCVAAGLALEG